MTTTEKKTQKAKQTEVEQKATLDQGTNLDQALVDTADLQREEHVKKEKESARKRCKYVHFMCDIEGLGLQPNKHPVLQIAVVVFDIETFKPTGDELTIYLPLVEQIQAGKQPLQSTVNFWNENESKRVIMTEILEEIKKCGTVADELTKLSDWVNTICRDKGYNGDTAHSMFWAKPTLFDYPFVDGLFMDAKVISPFNFRNVIDMSSYIVCNFMQTHKITKNYDMDIWDAQQCYWACMKTVKNQIKNSETTAHNATADCFFQIAWLREAILNTEFYLTDY